MSATCLLFDYHEKSSAFLRNVGKLQREHTASHPRITAVSTSNPRLSKANYRPADLAVGVTGLRPGLFQFPGIWQIDPPPRPLPTQDKFRTELRHVCLSQNLMSVLQAADKRGISAQNLVVNGPTILELKSDNMKTNLISKTTRLTAKKCT
jgi:hypothetical protein